MKIAFSTRGMDVYPHRYGDPLPEEVRGRVLRWGAAKGFDAAELEDSWALVEQMDDAELARLRDQARSAGLDLTLKLHYRDLSTPSVAAANEAGVLRNVEAAAKLGAKMVSFSIPTAEPVRQAAARELGRDWGRRAATRCRVRTRRQPRRSAGWGAAPPRSASSSRSRCTRARSSTLARR